ncbi:hypothetical protein [Pseudonocardia sp. GCM10023141]|uniref:hypothetical protein n=1 Tax=Pseudonocardia sp. GCM10023141 TaxID=3252653 RepID=UPI00360AF9E9
MMIDVTGWALLTWLKITLALAVGVGLVWLALPAGSGWFWVAVLAACVMEWFTIRQLGREWVENARWHWWWTR